MPELAPKEIVNFGKIFIQGQPEIHPVLKVRLVLDHLSGCLCNQEQRGEKEKERKEK